MALCRGDSRRLVSELTNSSICGCLRPAAGECTRRATGRWSNLPREGRQPGSFLRPEPPPVAYGREAVVGPSIARPRVPVRHPLRARTGDRTLYVSGGMESSSPDLDIALAANRADSQERAQAAASRKTCSHRSAVRSMVSRLAQDAALRASFRRSRRLVTSRSSASNQPSSATSRPPCSSPSPL